eukprot:COSAG01_NODE_5991_length_3913_cov_438.897483_2_plen_103_part_00
MLGITYFELEIRQPFGSAVCSTKFLNLREALLAHVSGECDMGKFCHPLAMSVSPFRPSPLSHLPNSLPVLHCEPDMALILWQARRVRKQRRTITASRSLHNR